MFCHETEYEICKKYCPALQKNVIIKVYHGVMQNEECTEQDLCSATGGCRNEYLHSADNSSHSL